MVFVNGLVGRPTIEFRSAITLHIQDVTAVVVACAGRMLVVNTIFYIMIAHDRPHNTHTHTHD